VQSILYLSATCCSPANARPGITVNGQIFRILILQDALNGTNCLYPMPGAHSKEIRSYNKSRIKVKDTKKPRIQNPKCCCQLASRNNHTFLYSLSIGFCRAQARKNPRSDGVFLDFLFLLSIVEECIKTKERAKSKSAYASFSEHRRRMSSLEECIETKESAKTFPLF